MSLSFTGLLHVHQVPHLNCLASQLPDHKDLAFKLKRKQFSIEVCCQGYAAYQGFLHKLNFWFCPLVVYFMLLLHQILFVFCFVGPILLSNVFL